MPRTCCHFIAPHLLKAIASSQNCGEQSRRTAMQTLQVKDAWREKRKAMIAEHHNADHPATGHRNAGIIPPLVLQSVAGSDAAGPESRAKAQQTLDSPVSTHDATEIEGAVPKPKPKPTSPTAVNRKVYDCQNTESLQKTLTRGEGSPRVKDRSSNNAYDGLGIVHEFYQKIYKRNSIDDKGLTLIGNVNFLPAGTDGYNNAYWDGEQMVFGDGDGAIFNDFTNSLDVIAHELTHGVTQYTAKLQYEGQSGALNESMSDVFAAQCEQWWFNEKAADGDWLVGQSVFAMLRRGPALRSMSHPGTAYTNDPVLGTDPQPADMAHYKNTSDDDGGVHLNSGIPNRAFYLAAVALGGNSYDRAGPIWYATLTDPTISETCDFKQFANLTVKHAAALYDADVQAKVKQAWTTVGVL